MDGEGDVIKIVAEGAARAARMEVTSKFKPCTLPSLYAHLDVALDWIMDAERNKREILLVTRPPQG